MDCVYSLITCWLCHFLSVDLNTDGCGELVLAGFADICCQSMARDCAQPGWTSVHTAFKEMEI